MDHQSLSSEALSPTLNSSSSVKDDLPSVIDLQPVDASIRPINEELQGKEEELQQVSPNMHGNPTQLHQVNNGIIVVDQLPLNENMQPVTEDHSQVSDPLAVANDDRLHINREMTEMGQNQDVQAISNQAGLLEGPPGVLSSHKSMKLPSFPNQAHHEPHDPHDLQLNNIGGGNASLPLDTSHYYESLHQSSVMVYEVPATNIVPFDSLVSVPLGKGIGEKSSEGVDLLQTSVSDAVYTHPSQDITHPLYVLHQPQKKENTSEGMVIEQINANDGVSPNIVLQNRDGNSFTKVEGHSSNMMPIGSEFSLISTSCYDNSVTTVANMANLTISAVYHSSTDTDSEVALTLASLGNPKIEKVERNCTQGQSCEHSNDIRAPSMIAGVPDHHHQLESNDQQPSVAMEKEMEKRNQKPTLVLRSRRNRGNANLHNQELSTEDTKKGNRKRKKRETKVLPLSKGEASEEFILPDSILPVKQLSTPSITLQNEAQKENLLGQLLKASEHCEPATLIPEGVVDDVIPAVGYRIMDMTNLSEMIRMMHRCTGSMGAIVIQEQASLREGAVSQLSVICTGCQEGAVCATSNRTLATGPWDINARVEQLTKEFNIKEDQVQRMLEILGIFYRPCDPSLQPILQPMAMEETQVPISKKKRKKKGESDAYGKPRNQVCTVCKERFIGENHLKKHMLSHDLSLHTCPYCHAYFKKPFNLKQHIKKHENYTYECSQCQRVFTDRSTLLCHIRSQHEKRLNIQCKICLKNFYHRSHYNEHMRIHTGEKPYMCELCGKKFSWHDSVKKHMQTHSAESKYKCRLCGKWFRWLQGIRQHLQQQHKLKKCDIEAQVVTTATETSALPQYHQQPQPPPQQQRQQQRQQQQQEQQPQQHQQQHQQQQQLQQQHQQQHQQHNQGQSQTQQLAQVSAQHLQEDSSVGRDYHTLEAAATNDEPTAPQALHIFHEGQQPEMFQYH